MVKHWCLAGFLSLFVGYFLPAQEPAELSTGWKCAAIGKVRDGGEQISRPAFSTRDWLNATVPGTVLTTLINNHLEPDPFFGLNNEKIPDIYTVGRDYYTYWFVKDFTVPPPAEPVSGKRETKTASAGREQVWLHFRGVNYGCTVWLNGHKLNATTHYGMYLRQTYNITGLLSAEGPNRLAVLVYPPDPVGNPNGGQGGDGEIARNVTHQYVAGWDWIQPIRDRNTGIWDKVTIEKTGPVRIQNPHIITEVPGVRWPGAAGQDPALLRVSAELVNPGPASVSGSLYYELEGQKVAVPVTVAAGATVEVKLPDHLLSHPRLWWPNGYGEAAMYHTVLSLATEGGAGTGGGSVGGFAGGTVSDTEPLDFGVRAITTSWNAVTRSRQVEVNGQKIFIKGGNWIVSDELLWLSQQRYDAEIRFHRDMNLNLIRVWGGALTERPEFYQACDRYGMLVFQDFWNSGDCNGRWEDPKKKEDQWTRRNYPDDHALFLASVADQVKLLRNHPSLAFWCGGNEITPPEDIFTAMKDSILPALDGTRYFFDYSNSDSMSFNTLGGNGDGPYGIQPVSAFWAKRTFPFNSEIGSVGMGDYESLERFIPREHLVVPVYPGKIDPVWEYHKYIGYDSSVYAYGPVKGLRDFAEKAQLVNYDQYRALVEGFSSHMWEWYTGAIIWKTQNPWTALRGQMYDYYLDVNACLYGLHTGSEPLHVMYDPVEGMVMIANNTFRTYRDLLLQVRTFDMAGKGQLLTQVFSEAGPTMVKKYVPLKKVVDGLRGKEGVFLSLRLLDVHQRIVSDNFYWLPDSTGRYSGLQGMVKSWLEVEAKEEKTPEGAMRRIAVTLRNPAGDPVAFFNRISLVNPVTKLRVLPVFYSDNYVSVLPGESKTIYLEYEPGNGDGIAAKDGKGSPEGAGDGAVSPQVSVRGWNVEEKLYPVK
jgi:mannosylglycoprotein endo-beta-mannosidase